MTIESENITSFRNTVKELCTIPPPSTISSNSNAKRRKRGKGGGGTIGNSTIHTNHTFQTQRTPHTQYSQRTNNTKGGGGGNNNGGVNDMNARAIRIAAITRALVETIDERLGTTTSNKMGEDDSDDNDDNSDDDDKDDGSAVAPAPLFLAVLEALSDTLPKLPTSTSTSTSSTSPKKRDKETMDDDNHTNEGKMAPHVIPLLEILRQIIPHVTQSNPNIVLTHFKSLSNTIRAICAIMVPVSTSGLDRDGGGGSKNGNNNSGGSNALTRIILNVSTLIIQNMFQLLQLETSNNTMYDKDILRFFHVTILNYWEDGRPKIRKEAHSCVLELLLLVVTSGKNISKVPTMLAPHMIRYCTKILQNAFMFHEKDVVVSSNNNNNNNNNNKRKNIVRKTMHVLSFLEQASSTIQIMMNNTTTSTTSGKNKESVNGLVLILTKLTITAVSLSSSSSSSATNNNMDAIMGISNNGNNMNNNGITIANMMDGFTMAGGALLALNRIFSCSKGDNYQDELATATTTTTNNNEQIQSLGMQTLATLLQNNASLLASATALANLAKKKKKGDSNTDDAVAAIQDGYTSCGGSTLLLYSRCIVTLVSCTTTTTSTTTTSSDKTISTIGKLIPECFSSIIRCLTIDSMVLNTDGASGICTEIQGLLQVLQMFLSTSNTDTEKKEWCQSIVMSCIPPFSKVLHPTYRPRWEYVLSCMASFVVYAAATTTTTNNNDDDDDNDDDDENDNSTQITNTLSSFPLPLKDLVEALVDLHRSTSTTTSSSSTKDRKRRRNNNNNTSSGNNVTTMVEASSIERSIGTIASGLGLELFLNIIDLSLPCNGGVGNSMDSGAVCDERSWLLPILTSSNMNAATPVVTTMFSSSLDCSQPQLSPPPRLSFFKNVILDLARKCDAAAAKTTTTMAAAVTKQRSSILQSRVYDLWSLFPCFCIRVTNKDLQDMFPNLVVTLVKAMGDVRYPKLVVRNIYVYFLFLFFGCLGG